MSKKVKVAFTPGDPKSWTFDKNPAKISKHGWIELRRDPKSPDWLFVEATGLPSGYASGTSDDEKVLTIIALGDPPFDTDITYSVTVKDLGGTYKSPMSKVIDVAVGPPPIIVNDGTIPMVGKKPKKERSSAKKTSAKKSSAKRRSAKKPSAKKSSAKKANAKKSSAKRR